MTRPDLPAPNPPPEPAPKDRPPSEGFLTERRLRKLHDGMGEQVPPHSSPGEAGTEPGRGGQEHRDV